MTIPDRESPIAQHNHGPGTFVGGHVFGNVEMVDPKTRSVLAKISRDAPKLGELLSEALRDGVISPDTAVALASAAHNINEDVAHSLWEAGQNINEDVATSLAMVGDSINPEVASSLHDTAGELSNVADRFEQVMQQLTRASGVLNSTGVDADEWGRTAEAMENAAHNLAVATQLHAQAEDEFSWSSFWKGLGAGIVAAIILMGMALALQN